VSEEGWEVVYQEPHTNGDTLERFRVPGGWLYRSTQCIEGSDGCEPDEERTESMTFVPDPAGTGGCGSHLGPIDYDQEPPVCERCGERVTP
jgi:hypothetical protein